MNEIMKGIVIELKNKFNNIKSMGWIESHRSGDTGIGKTLEDLLDKKEDNKSDPDYKGIELKSQRSATSSMITLFTKSPEHPNQANTLLRTEYGNENENNMKILHTTISAKDFNTHISGNDFKILIDKEKQKIKILIKKHSTGEIIDGDIFWSFSGIEEKLSNKLSYVAYITADEKKEKGKTFFKFEKMKIITGLNMRKFINALEKGDILVDIRIGVYNSGKNKGKTHDHGTGFRITYENLMKYADAEEVE